MMTDLPHPLAPSPRTERGPGGLSGVGILDFVAVSPTPRSQASDNPSPVKKEGLPEPFFPFPSLRGEGAGVRGKPNYLPLKGPGGEVNRKHYISSLLKFIFSLFLLLALSACGGLAGEPRIVSTSALPT